MILIALTLVIITAAVVSIYYELRIAAIYRDQVETSIKHAATTRATMATFNAMLEGEQP